MENGREVKRRIGFGVLILTLGINLVAENSVVCKGGKCVSTILQKNVTAKSSKVSKFKTTSDSYINGFNVKKRSYFIPLDNNEPIDNDEDIIISSMKKVNRESDKSNILFKAHKIYACDDDYRLVCEKPENKDKEVCECIS